MRDFQKDFKDFKDLSDLLGFLSILFIERGSRLPLEPSMITGYIVSELLEHGKIENTNCDDIAKSININMVAVRNTIKQLSDFGVIKKYPLVRKSKNGESYVPDKKIFSIIPTQKLFNLLEENNFTIAISGEELNEIHDYYVKESEKLNGVKYEEPVIQREEQEEGPLNIMEKLVKDLQSANDDKEKVILIHNVMRTPHRITASESKEYKLGQYITLYDRLCLIPFKNVNEKADERKFKTIPETPRFK